MPDFTHTDRRVAHQMGVSLDDAPDCSYEAAAARLYQTLSTAYQRLDAECARVHCAERDGRTALDVVRKWRNRLIWLCAIAVGIAAGEGWVIWHG